jgi:hypothetical protein
MGYKCRNTIYQHRRKRLAKGRFTMIEILNPKKIAVLEDDKAVVRIEDRLRVTSYQVDYLNRHIRIFLRRGYVNGDGTFTVSTKEPILIEINDSKNKLFTVITTPKETDKDRWSGDFRLIDIEESIKTIPWLTNKIEQSGLTIGEIKEQK